MSMRTAAEPALLTPAMEKRRNRNLSVVAEYVRLMDEEPTRSRTQLREYLMKKYGIPTVAGYYFAIQSAINDEETPEELKKGWRRHQQKGSIKRQSYDQYPT